MFQSQFGFIPFDFHLKLLKPPKLKAVRPLKVGLFVRLCFYTACPPVNPSRPALVGQIVVTCVVNLFSPLTNKNTPFWLFFFVLLSYVIICHPLVPNRESTRRSKKFILSQLLVSFLITCFFLFHLLFYLQEWKPSCPSSLTTRPRRSTSSSWFGSPTSTMRCAVTRPSPNVTGWGE